MSRVIVLEAQGVPIAQIASQFLWDIVEYLSAQRVVVDYSYRDSYFEARFPRMTVDAVQRTIDEWTAVQTRSGN